VLVDAQSGQVWATLPPVAVDGASWTLALWYLQEQGVVCASSVSDGGMAIHEALQTTKAISTHQRDVWHLLRLAGQVQARLERAVQAEEDRQRVIERQARELAITGRRSAGRPAKTTSSEQAQLLIELHRLLEAARYLFAQLRELVEIVVLTGRNEPRLLDYQTRRSEVQTVLDLLEEAIQSVPLALRHEVQRVIKQVRLALPALLYFAQDMEACQQEAIAQLGEPPEQLLEAMDPAWRAAAARLLATWNQAVRASSVVENWHSIVRPHLAVHRSLSAGILALLAVWHNHRIAQRGLHQGQSPLMRSGMSQQSHDWLVALGYPPQGMASGPESDTEPQPLAWAA
jgi:hypothetical protein